MTDVNNLSSMGGFINKKIKPLKDEISIIKTELKNIKKLLKAINYTQCCEELKGETGYNNIEDTDPNWMSYIEDMKT